MKLSEFKNADESKSINNAKTESKEYKENAKNTNTQKEKSIEELYGTYKNMNSNQLLNELLKQVDNQKKDGTFNFDGLKNSLNQVMPFLNEEQKNNLMTILNQIK